MFCSHTPQLKQEEHTCYIQVSWREVRFGSLRVENKRGPPTLRSNTDRWLKSVALSKNVEAASIERHCYCIFNFDFQTKYKHLFKKTALRVPRYYYLDDVCKRLEKNIQAFGLKIQNRKHILMKGLNLSASIFIRSVRWYSLSSLL